MPESFPFDSFARDNLPPREQWPDLRLEGLHYPDQLNCVTALLDDRVAAGEGLRPCLMSLTETWSYADLLTRVNRIANVLSHQLGMVRGKLVLLRAPNTKLMVAAYLGLGNGNASRARAKIVADDSVATGAKSDVGAVLAELGPRFAGGDVHAGLAPVVLDFTELKRALRPTV